MPTVFSSLTRSFSGLIGVIGPVSLASIAVMVISTSAAIIPLLGPGTGSFVYQWFMGLLGILPKRKKVWGTIYDASTKRPIPFAKVQLLDQNRRVLETRIADKNGRYGFLATPEGLMARKMTVSIRVSHSGYSFPSKISPSVDRLIYGNIYYGGDIEMQDGKLVNFDIPLDSLKVRRTPLALVAPSVALGTSIAAMADTSFWLGLIVVPLNFILRPDPFSFGTLCLFLGTASLRLFGLAEHPYGLVKDSKGRPVPFALMALNDTKGRRVAFTVSDEFGRYFLPVARGSYELIAYTPATIQPMRQTRLIIDARRGWITQEIEL